ncbi:hypothetical protein BV898_04340 [Hypsibius exemplaris]|uniref:Uncharacterized protein n=1 Tax=Hypsibius exemplaris TaxID=2072580 RepID=A0A1W0X2S4_HYPEX|nr:hypothetical protein BV898_04340 [Hypsibius exemplaris]
MGPAVHPERQIKSPQRVVSAVARGAGRVSTVARGAGRVSTVARGAGRVSTVGSTVIPFHDVFIGPTAWVTATAVLRPFYTV